MDDREPVGDSRDTHTQGSRHGNLEVSGESVTCDVCDTNGQSLATLHSPASVSVAASLLSQEPYVFPFEVA